MEYGFSQVRVSIITTSAVCGMVRSFTKLTSNHFVRSLSMPHFWFVFQTFTSNAVDTLSDLQICFSVFSVTSCARSDKYNHYIPILCHVTCEPCADQMIYIATAGKVSQIEHGKVWESARDICLVLPKLSPDTLKNNL